MDEQFNSIVKQLNRLVKKQTGLSPRAKTIERALKHFVDNYSGGGAGGDSIWGNIIGSIENQTDLINKIDEMIDAELANFEHLDYEVVDTIPTPATAEEGVRYLYKPAGATAYNEYILIGGAIYNIGSTEDINLDNYYTKTEVDAELNGKADVSDLPTKTSDLTNDSQFVDKDTNQLTNYTTTTAMNNALNLKADKTTTYTKDETDAKLDLKADADDIPTKTSDLTNDSGYITKDVSNLTNYTKTTDLNTALALKANAADIPTKTSDLTNDTGYIDANVNNLTNYTKTTDLNDALNLKADKATTYNKTEVNTALDLKADKSTTYTKTEVDNKIKNTKQTTGTATDTYSTDYLNKALQNHAISLRSGANMSVANNDTIPFSFNEIVGDKLTQNGSVVKVGSGVSKLKISFQVQAHYSVTKDKFYGATVYRNGIETGISAQTFFPTAAAGNLSVSAIPMVYMAVSEGDEFSLKFYSTATGSQTITKNSWFTVEVIE